ncbi:MAG: LTA synthase family protein [Ignavibacteriales bacterium]
MVIHKSAPRNANQLIAVIDLPVFMYLYVKHNQFLKTMHYEDNIILACLVLILVIESINFLKGKSLIQLIKRYPQSESTVVENYGTLINMLIDFCMFHNNDEIAKQFNYGEPKTIKSESLKKPNIIIIQMESVDSNSVNLTHDGSYVMPFLHSLTDKSIYYPYMMNYHKAGGTSDAEFSIMNSVEPLSNFPSIKLPSYEHKNSFVRVLSQNSYSTSIFHGNHASYYKRDYAFSSMGFDKFYDMEDMNLKDAGWGAPDHEVFNFVLEKMKNQSGPFFYYIITMSNHCKFLNVLNYYHNASFDGITNKNMRNFYNSLSYVDITIQAFVEEALAIDKETYIIILGDHTPGLKDKIYKQASIRMENRHLEFVPLFIISPEGTIYKENEKVVSFLDIAPTVLGFANICSQYSTYGESIIPPLNADGKIPYRGYLFDRRQLYNAVGKPL